MASNNILVQNILPSLVGKIAKKKKTVWRSVFLLFRHSN